MKKLTLAVVVALTFVSCNAERNDTGVTFEYLALPKAKLLSWYMGAQSDATTVKATMAQGVTLLAKGLSGDLDFDAMCDRVSAGLSALGAEGWEFVSSEKEFFLFKRVR